MKPLRVSPLVGMQIQRGFTTYLWNFWWVDHSPMPWTALASQMRSAPVSVVCYPLTFRSGISRCGTSWSCSAARNMLKASLPGSNGHRPALEKLLIAPLSCSFTCGACPSYVCFGLQLPFPAVYRSTAGHGLQNGRFDRERAGCCIGKWGSWSIGSLLLGFHGYPQPTSLGIWHSVPVWYVQTGSHPHQYNMLCFRLAIVFSYDPSILASMPVNSKHCCQSPWLSRSHCCCHSNHVLDISALSGDPSRHRVIKQKLF